LRRAGIWRGERLRAALEAHDGAVMLVSRDPAFLHTLGLGRAVQVKR
jgi:ATPase subunit of ABC transporter with duplicated ATPase domains